MNLSMDAFRMSVKTRSSEFLRPQSVRWRGGQNFDVTADSHRGHRFRLILGHKIQADASFHDRFHGVVTPQSSNAHLRFFRLKRGVFGSFCDRTCKCQSKSRQYEPDQKNFFNSVLLMINPIIRIALSTMYSPSYCGAAPTLRSVAPIFAISESRKRQKMPSVDGEDVSQRTSALDQAHLIDRSFNMPSQTQFVRHEIKWQGIRTTATVCPVHALLPMRPQSEPSNAMVFSFSDLISASFWLAEINAENSQQIWICLKNQETLYDGHRSGV